MFAGDVDIIEPPGPSMTAAVGDTVELVCENDDQSTLEWSRDGMPLISGSHYSIRYVITYCFMPQGFLFILTKLYNKVKSRVFQAQNKNKFANLVCPRSIFNFNYT